jgi:hypothetical protein
LSLSLVIPAQATTVWATVARVSVGLSLSLVIPAQAGIQWCDDGLGGMDVE